MNIYQPYEVLADTEDCLHLKETETRERIHFVIFRMFPIFLLFFSWYILQQVGTKIPMTWDYLLIAIIIIFAGILFFKTYITEIKIAEDKIFFIQKTVNGSKEVSIPLSDVEKITIKRKRGKTIGAFFTLHTRKGKSYLLLSIPGFYADEHHVKLVTERLQQMLHAEVV